MKKIVRNRRFRRVRVVLDLETDEHGLALFEAQDGPIWIAQRINHVVRITSHVTGSQPVRKGPKPGAVR